MKLFTIILAAGKGTRMKSRDDKISKVAYPILGRPLVRYVLETIKPLGSDRIITIVGFGGDLTKAIVDPYSEIAWQREFKGTGHAIMQVTPMLEGQDGITLIVCGDTPLLETETLRHLIKEHQKTQSDLTVLSAVIDDPHGYGRIIRDGKEQVIGIIEQADADDNQKQIKEINAGVYVFDNHKLFEELQHLTPANKQGEYYLTDLIAIFHQKGYRLNATVIRDFKETLGINDRAQLADAAFIIQMKINRAHMKNGVTIESPGNTFIGPEVTIKPDTTIKPGCYIMGATTIGANNVIGPDTTMENMTVGHGNMIIKSHLVDSIIGDNNKVGPFTHMRGHSELMNDTRVGNFVETKAALLHDGVKAAHLTYLGDTTIDEKANIGCGTITANYDGKNKWHTHIGKNVFIGSGTTIIAPLTVADDAFVAAGSTINKDVAKDDFAIARARQENKPGYAAEIRKRIDEKGKKK